MKQKKATLGVSKNILMIYCRHCRYFGQNFIKIINDSSMRDVLNIFWISFRAAKNSRILDDSNLNGFDIDSTLFHDFRNDLFIFYMYFNLYKNKRIVKNCGEFVDNSSTHCTLEELSTNFKSSENSNPTIKSNQVYLGVLGEVKLNRDRLHI